jgi:4-amino-4-deoxy-L-arabinose transferase-like glycosyltransferase
VLYGEQIANGNGYTLPDGHATAYYPIGYPGLLGALLWIVDVSPLPDERLAVVVGLNVVLAAATVVALFEVVRRLATVRTALVAAALVAVWPNVVFHGAVALTETLFLFLVVVLTLVLVARPWTPDGLPVRRVLLAGAVLGLAALVRPTVVALVPLLPVAWVAAGIGWRRSLAHGGVMVATAAVVIAPWTVRNWIVMDAFVPISTNTGDNLCIGHEPGATGRFALSEYCLAGYDHLERPEYEIVRDREGREKAIRRALGHPLDEIPLVAKRAWYTLRSDHDALDAAESYGDDRFLGSGTRRALSWVADGFYFAVLVLGVAGLVPWLRGAAGDRRRLLVVLVGASALVAPLVSFGDPRFKLPMLPFVAVSAAAALAGGAAAWRPRRGATSTASTADPPARRPPAAPPPSTRSGAPG